MDHAEWTGSAEQKLWGLMVVWAEAKFAFPRFDALPDLDWDASAQSFIPRVLAAPDLEAYYAALMEFAALLNDAHTEVVPPWGYLKPGDDAPPLEIEVLHGRFTIARTGDSAELAEQRVQPGQELIAVEQTPVAEYFRERVLRFHRRGSAQADAAVSLFYLLRGPRDSRVALTVRDQDGAARDVVLTRNSAAPQGPPFMPRFVQWNMVDPALTTRDLPGGVLYVKLAHFNDPASGAAFLDLIDGLDPAALKGMVIDLRWNLGGNSAVAEQMISGLIAEPVSSPVWKYPHYIAAHNTWGRPPTWSETHNAIVPREGKRWLGPLTLLTGGGTNSTAEDFAISLHYTGRATLVGGKTAGSAGNPLHAPLPGGGVFRAATFTATYPDGREYVGIGVQPDVELYPTPQDLAAGNDPVLAKGVETLLNGGA